MAATYTTVYRVHYFSHSRGWVAHKDYATERGARGVATSMRKRGLSTDITPVEVPDKGAPEPGKEYLLIGGTGEKAISNGNTWPESEVVKLSAEGWLATAEFAGTCILDPDGWDRRAADWAAEWSTPLTRGEFMRRLSRSTVGPKPRGRAVPEPTEPEPSMDQLERMSFDGVCTATDGCETEPDGECEHGHLSWLRYMGLI